MLKDKVAIVTGGGSGIGQAIAAAYAREGAKVVVADLEGSIRASGDMPPAQGLAAGVVCDVSDEQSVMRMIDEVTGRFGRIDVLVNNAGVFPFAEVETMSVAAWDRVFAVNVRGSFLCVRAAVPAMKRQRSGKIVNIGSSTFFNGLAGSAAYVASKGAIVGLTRSLAREFGSHNIQVNTLTPGLTRTTGVVTAGCTDAYFESFAAQQCLGRTEVPEDLVGAAVFLASSHSDFMTGQILNVDGGLNTH